MMYFLMMASNVFHQQTFLYKYFCAFLTSEHKSLNRIVLAKLGVMLGITTIRDSRQKCKSKSECHAGHYHHSRIPTEMHTQNHTGPYERCIFFTFHIIIFQKCVVSHFTVHPCLKPMFSSDNFLRVKRSAGRHISRKA